MDNGQWKMDNEQWTMNKDNGQWTMGNGQWILDNGQWTMDNGQSPESFFLRKNLSSPGNFLLLKVFSAIFFAL